MSSPQQGNHEDPQEEATRGTKRKRTGARRTIVTVDRGRIVDPFENLYGPSPYETHPNSRRAVAVDQQHPCSQAARSELVAKKFKLRTLLFLFSCAEDAKKNAADRLGAH